MFLTNVNDKDFLNDEIRMKKHESNRHIVVVGMRSNHTIGTEAHTNS